MKVIACPRCKRPRWTRAGGGLCLRCQKKEGLWVRPKARSYVMSPVESSPVRQGKPRRRKGVHNG